MFPTFFLLSTMDYINDIHRLKKTCVMTKCQRLSAVKLILEFLSYKVIKKDVFFFHSMYFSM